jgi:hypothetical protein
MALKLVEATGMSDASQRRSSPRQRFFRLAQFYNPDALKADSQRLCVTRDFSRDGVYFVAGGNGLKEHMRLVMQFPDSAAHAAEHEYLVEVMRINALPDDQCGIGARLVLRTMLGRCRDLIVPRLDLGLYERMSGTPGRLVDLRV